MSAFFLIHFLKSTVQEVSVFSTIVGLSLDVIFSWVQGVFEQFKVLSQSWTVFTVTWSQNLAASWSSYCIHWGQITSFVASNDMFSFSKGKDCSSDIWVNINRCNSRVTIVPCFEWCVVTNPTEESSVTRKGLHIEESTLVGNTFNHTVHVWVNSASLEDHSKLLIRFDDFISPAYSVVSITQVLSEWVSYPVVVSLEEKLFSYIKRSVQKDLEQICVIIWKDVVWVFF